MVRLKANKMRLDFLKVAKFQFHMVRLKVKVSQTSMTHNPISIPYGTIKSRELLGMKNILNFISIPYGTIKSVDAKVSEQKTQIFQFHMVRLKVVEAIHYFANLAFQFHMVRLKGSIDISE